MEGDNSKEAAKEVSAPLPAVGKTTMNVLVAIDDSEESFHALQWVLDKMFRPSPAAPEQETKVITIVHVVEPLPRYAFPGGYGLFF